MPEHTACTQNQNIHVPFLFGRIVIVSISPILPYRLFELPPYPEAAAVGPVALRIEMRKCFAEFPLVLFHQERHAKKYFKTVIIKARKD
jgi:hypothetical protein